MATLITFKTNAGSIRRCDATCHTAMKPECVCVCRGRYHGTGSSSASLAKLTKDYTEIDDPAQDRALMELLEHSRFQPLLTKEEGK